MEENKGDASLCQMICLDTRWQGKENGPLYNTFECKGCPKQRQEYETSNKIGLYKVDTCGIPRQ